MLGPGNGPCPGFLFARTKFFENLAFDITCLVRWTAGLITGALSSAQQKVRRTALPAERAA